MFEFTGWGAIKSDGGSDADDEALMSDLHAYLATMTPSMRACFHIPEPANGYACVTMTGLRNHYRHEVVGLLTWITARSRRSYGLVHVRSDDTSGDKDAFRVFRLVDGRIDDCDDPFFS